MLECPTGFQRLTAREQTGYCYDPRMLTHHPYEENPNDRHPEQPQRILKIYEKLRGAAAATFQRLARADPLRIS